MKLRTQLFLWVGILFFLAFGVSLMFEDYTTSHNLQESEVNLRQQIISLGEKKRENIETFLHISLIEQQALIDALLLHLGRDSDLGKKLFLDPSNLMVKAPLHSALLFREKNWIDFIQTTKDGALTSLLTPLEFPMTVSHFIPIEEDFGWVVLDCDQQIDRPFIGVRYYVPPSGAKDPESADPLKETDWGLVVLFNPTALARFQMPAAGELRDPFGGMTAFLHAIQAAAAFVQENGREEANWIREDIVQRQKSRSFFSNQSFDRTARCLGREGEALNNRVIELLQRSDQGVMVAVLASLFPSGAFGKNFFSKRAPQGIARIPKGEVAGNAAFINEIFGNAPLFDDRAYTLQFPSAPACEGIGSALAVIYHPQVQRVFVGNTLTLSDGTANGYVTVGVNVNELVQNLTFSTDRSAFLVHQGKVVCAYGKDGMPIANPREVIPLSKKMLVEKSGLFSSKGQNYYFLHMVPFPQVDLHFYTIESEKRAFALIRSVEESAKKVIAKVSLNMRTAALIALAVVLWALHRISNRITEPISRLASATQDVAAGNLEGIDLPKPSKGKNDEVAMLLASFDQMIVGLKEKEKVKGILNKVVSPEIAQEITKGAIHLGGEERMVTVLFADIRNFTRMSADKDPALVIEMLNTCMTKVSQQVDAFGGVIDKYVGDEVMALFGVPIEKEKSALSAVLAALQMVNVLKEWNDKRRGEGKLPIEMGFGIHTGIAVVGNMGAENRLNYTVVGANVNFANRLCSIAQAMEILISKETLSQLHVQESLIVEECPPVKVKGYDQPFVVYKVKGAK